MQPGGRSRHGTFVLCKDALEVLEVVLGDGAVELAVLVLVVYDIAWKRRLSECEELLLELVVGTVVEEAQRSATRGGVVDYFGNERAVVVEEELVAYTYLACRLYQHIPQAHLLVELAEEEDLNLCVCLLLRTVQTCRHHSCVVEDERVVLSEVVEDVEQRQSHLLAVFSLDKLALGIGLEEGVFL